MRNVGQTNPAYAARSDPVRAFHGRLPVAARAQVSVDPTYNRRQPLRFPPRRPHHASAADRPRRGSDRLQKSRSPRKIRHRKRQNSPPPRHRHACAHAPQNHSRNQAQPLGAADEIVVEALVPSPCFLVRRLTNALTTLSSRAKSRDLLVSTRSSEV